MIAHRLLVGLCIIKPAKQAQPSFPLPSGARQGIHGKTGPVFRVCTESAQLNVNKQAKPTRSSKRKQHKESLKKRLLGEGDSPTVVGVVRKPVCRETKTARHLSAIERH